MMRAQDAPRKVYTRNGLTHVCFQGITFRAPRISQITPEKEIIHIEPAPRIGGKARVIVSQRHSGKLLKETWTECDVPVKRRQVRTSTSG
jgi:hypothetical protein